MKLDKKNIIVILLMGLFIMILCIKYYAGINVKSEFNHNEVGAPVNKEDSYYNDSNELEEKQDNKSVVKTKSQKEEPKVAATKETVKEEKKESKDYSKMTLTELKAVAKEQGVKGYSTMKKDELISNLK